MRCKLVYSGSIPVKKFWDALDMETSKQYLPKAPNISIQCTVKYIGMMDAGQAQRDQNKKYKRLGDISSINNKQVRRLVPAQSPPSSVLYLFWNNQAWNTVRDSLKSALLICTTYDTCHLCTKSKTHGKHSQIMISWFITLLHGIFTCLSKLDYSRLPPAVHENIHSLPNLKTLSSSSSPCSHDTFAFSPRPSKSVLLQCSTL